MTDKPMTFEQALARLEQITNAIEYGEVTLEETIAKHEEGMKLLEFCKKTLEQAEQRITRLTAGDSESKKASLADNPPPA